MRMAIVLGVNVPFVGKKEGRFKVLSNIAEQTIPEDGLCLEST